ncbi:ABC transporter permease [Thermus oshimai]|jgi:NitT/TauT family transport system permease protein|uniref:ABC-type nitrate/sulfonate/bicarbonate transport system, permease component n=1 Tax=Thermus oshimai JL-2 TaxID=751945 RepID=K7QZ68_THEOS|nr:ABC transporter permease [Thermus oshimai]AFV77418.1 ABC-type nitrate/sulfonate/bicarbonate transport system, permease component [Thermus oshimai JL-2]
MRGLRVRAWQAGLLLALLALWEWASRTGRLDPFFFSQPSAIAARVHRWFSTGEVYPHLYVTTLEMLLAFAIGTLLGVVFGLWLALAPGVAAVLDPYVKALNAIPRVVLAPIFTLWFGLGVLSKVALGVTLVFFVAFFNTYQGVKEVSPVVLQNARLLGATRFHLLRHVYLPSAASWIFSSLRTSIGFAVIGAVVGEYLGSAAGLGYLIAQAEGVFDTTGVFAGMVVLMAFVLVLDALVGALERRLLVWRPQGEGGQR